MLSTDLPTVFLSGAVIAGLFLSLYALRRQFLSEKWCHSLLEDMETRNARSVSLKKMAEVEIALTELTDSYDALLKSHKKLRSRIGMRANRQVKSEPNGFDNDAPPADDAGKAAYKAKFRAEMKRKGLI